MTSEPTPTEVGSIYDKISDIFTEALGGSIHCGYWDDPANGQQTMEMASSRLTSLVADQLALTPGRRVIDIGCGTGKPAVQVATAHEAHVTGITVSNRQVELAQARVEGGPRPEQTCFQMADAMRLPFPDDSFDGAYAIESLIHMSDKSAALEQIARVLRPGSRLVVADILLDGPVGDPDTQLLKRICHCFQIPSFSTAQEYRDLLQHAGFRVLEFTDIRDNVKRSYGILASELRRIELDGDIGKQLHSVASDLEQIPGQLGYGLITAVRT